jgi:hypothetical protein
MDSEKAASISINATRGCIGLYVDDVSDFELFASDIRSLIGDPGAVQMEHIPWAGPYEAVMLISSVVGAVGGLAGGVASVLSLFAKRHPEKTITVRTSDGTTVSITGEELTPEDVARVNELFAANRTPLSEATADIPFPTVRI